MTYYVAYALRYLKYKVFWVDAVACHHVLLVETRYSVDPTSQDVPGHFNSPKISIMS